MATNKIFRENTRLNRAVKAPVGTKSGDAFAYADQIVVALTDRGDATRTFTRGQSTFTVPSGGVGLAADEASVAFDGTWLLPVSDYVHTTHVNGAPVYAADLENGQPVTLTMNKGADGVKVGFLDFPVSFAKTDGYAAVRIGVSE